MDGRPREGAQGDQEKRQGETELHGRLGGAKNPRAGPDGRRRQENVRQDRHRFGAEDAVLAQVVVLPIPLDHAGFSTLRITKRSSSSSPKVLTGLGTAA